MPNQPTTPNSLPIPNTQKPQTPKIIQTSPSKPKYIFVVLGLVLLGILAFFLIRNQKNPILNYTPVPSSSSLPSQATASGTLTPTTKLLNLLGKSLSLSMLIDSSTSGKLTGKISVKNTTNSSFANLYAGFYLFSDLIDTPKTINGKLVHDFSRGPLVAYVEQPIQDILGNQSKDISFSLPFSPNISSSDNYQAESVIFTKYGDTVSVASKKISLSGSNAFLTFDNCKVVVGGHEYDPIEAPLSSDSQPAIGRCSVTNPTSKPITATGASIVYGVLHVPLYPASAKQTTSLAATFAFQPNETKSIEIPLPRETEPQVYESYITLNDQNSNALSPPMLFRWSIKGPSAKFESAILNNDYYAKGENISVTITVSPSMDLYWGSQGTQLLNSKLQLTIMDKNGLVCAQVKKQLPPTQGSGETWKTGYQTVLTSLSQIDCQDPQIEVKVVDSGKVLATFSNRTITSASHLRAPAVKPTNQLSKIILAAAIALIIIILILIIIKLKKNHSSTVSMLILLISVLISVFILLEFNQPKQVGADCCNFPGSTQSAGDSQIDYNRCSLSSTGVLQYGFSAYQSDASTVYVTSYMNAGAYGCSNCHHTNTVYHNFSEDVSGYTYNESHTMTVSGSGSDTNANIIAFSFPDFTMGFTASKDRYLKDAVEYDITTSDNNILRKYYDSLQVDLGAPPPSCPNNSTTCSGQTYTDVYGNTCTGTKVCDTTPPTVSIYGFPPVDGSGNPITCFTAASWDSSLVQPLKINANDNVGGSGVNPSQVYFKLYNSDTNTTSVPFYASSVSGLGYNYQTSISSTFLIGPSTGYYYHYSLTAYAADNAGNLGNSPASSFIFATDCSKPFLSTQSGDVHSNTNINVQGGQ